MCTLPRVCHGLNVAPQHTRPPLALPPPGAGTQQSALTRPPSSWCSHSSAHCKSEIKLFRKPDNILGGFPSRCCHWRNRSKLLVWVWAKCFLHCCQSSRRSLLCVWNLSVLIEELLLPVLCVLDHFFLLGRLQTKPNMSGLKKKKKNHSGSC